MRFAWFILFVLFEVPFCPLPPIHAQTNMLDRYVGRDLWKQRLSKDEQLSLERIVGKVPKGQMTEPVPWHVWKTKSHEPTRYIVLLGESLILIPGGSSACVQLFDSTTRRINSWSFQVGWRADLYDASMEYSDDFASDMIILRTAPVINGRNITKEYFSLKNDRLRFVRLENDKGALVQNEYVFPNYEIGIIPDAKTVEEWAALLQSEDKADVLSALIFLSGKHIDEPEKQLLPGPHESNYVGLYKKLTRSARIHDLVEHLAESENNWVRQAALLVTSKPKVVKH
jgi:hypothetical protein